MLNLSKYGFKVEGRAPTSENLDFPHKATVKAFEVLQSWILKFDHVDLGPLDLDLSIGSDACSMHFGISDAQYSGPILTIKAYDAKNGRVLKFKHLDGDAKDVEVKIRAEIVGNDVYDAIGHDNVLNYSVSLSDSSASVLHVVASFIKDKVIPVFKQANLGHSTEVYKNRIINQLGALSHAS
jgi:hypothetical protein